MAGGEADHGQPEGERERDVSQMMMGRVVNQESGGDVNQQDGGDGSQQDGGDVIQEAGSDVSLERGNDGIWVVVGGVAPDRVGDERQEMEALGGGTGGAGETADQVPDAADFDLVLEVAVGDGVGQRDGVGEDVLERDQEEELFDLQNRSRPPVPHPVPAGEATEGWNAVDRVGAFDSFLVEFTMLQEVSEQHKGAWAGAYVEVLTRWRNATCEDERDRTLLWLGFLPQLLQRKPSRGGRKGRAEVAYRYKCVCDGNWGELVNIWERDRKKVQLWRLDSASRRREELAEEDREGRELAKLRQEVLGLISYGDLSRAMSRVTSHGVGDCKDPAIQAQLSEKFPPRSHRLPASVSKCQPIDSFRDLRQSLLSLQAGVSPGSGGLRNEYLVALGERMEDGDIKLLEELGLEYLAGELPLWFYRVWLCIQTVALYKTARQTDVRPLGLRNSLIKVFHKEAMSQSRPEVREFLEPQQLGMSQAGAAKLVNAVRGLISTRREFICVKIDLVNAFNEISRSSILETLESESSLSHLSAFAATILAPETELETVGKRWGRTGQGVVQGDPPSGELFDIGLQPSLVQLDSDCGVAGGVARGGHDDICALGPLEVVIPAVLRFQREVWDRCHLRLQWGKTQLFSWDGHLPADAPVGLTLAGEILEGEFERGFEIYGIPVGSDKFVQHKLKQKAVAIARDAVQTAGLLSGDRQALWHSLRLSISHRFDYFCQHTPPSLVEPVAEWLDGVLWSVLETAAGLPIPRGGDAEMRVRCPVRGLDSLSYQEWLVRLPVKLYGWGFRSLKDSCGPAYLGALETAIPFMSARGKICPQLEQVWGGRECWGEGADSETRWRVLLSSGCMEGRELREVWDKVKGEAVESADWLGVELQEVFVSAVEGVGGSSINGETKKKIVTAVEKNRSLLLTKSLELHRPRKARQVMGWRQRDKISCSWILAGPGKDTTLTSAEFSEAAAANLCLPSPACSGRIGEVVRGRVVVDQYGDSVQATNVRGDHWRTRHDQVKLTLHNLCKWAGLPVEMEVFNLFSRLIPQQGLARIETGRQRQGMVPDFKIVIPEAGETRPVLHELKVVSFGKTRYKPGWRERAVDVRAAQLHQEYVDKARRADQQYGGVVVGTVGPVERKLLSFGQVKGLVFGNFGEVSEATHKLLDIMATSRVRVALPQTGRRGVTRSEEGEKALAVSYIRRRVSVAGVKGQCHTLLGRLEVIGPGTAAAAGRRREATAQEEKWRRARQAMLLSERQGRDIIRRGFALLD